MQGVAPTEHIVTKFSTGRYPRYY